MQFYTFKYWKSLLDPEYVSEVESEIQMLSCNECSGDGIVECEYGHEHPCPDCDGTGESDEVDEKVLLKEYRDTVRADVLKYSRVIGKEHLFKDIMKEFTSKQGLLENPNQTRSYL